MNYNEKINVKDEEKRRSNNLKKKIVIENQSINK